MDDENLVTLITQRNRRIRSVLTMHVHFSADYFAARERFHVAARSIGAQQISYPLDWDNELSIDVAILGDESAKSAVVISSGLHGLSLIHI